jgi:hypothetical protein
MPRLFRVMAGTGQWMITTRRRMWILSPGIMLAKAAIILFAAVTLIYAVWAGIRVRQSEAVIAKIGTITNDYANKNSRQVERTQQILLFAYNLFTRSAEKGRVLGEPYAAFAQVEGRLGAADARETSDQGRHLAWSETTYEKPRDWPNGSSINKSWPAAKGMIVEAWFDQHGLLMKLIVTRRDKENRIERECIGRLPSEWNLQSY